LKRKIFERKRWAVKKFLDPEFIIDLNERRNRWMAERCVRIANQFDEHIGWNIVTDIRRHNCHGRRGIIATD